MRKILAVALALAASSAYGQGSYSQLVDKQRLCSMTGHGWAEVWEHDTLGGKTVKQMSKEKEAGKLDEKSFMALYMLHVYASSQKHRFSSAHDAYMAGWARCMDEK